MFNVNQQPTSEPSEANSNPEMSRFPSTLDGNEPSSQTPSYKPFGNEGGMSDTPTDGTMQEDDDDDDMDDDDADDSDELGSDYEEEIPDTGNPETTQPSRETQF